MVQMVFLAVTHVDPHVKLCAKHCDYSDQFSASCLLLHAARRFETGVEMNW